MRDELRKLAENERAGQAIAGGASTYAMNQERCDTAAGSESLRSRAYRRAQTSSMDAARHRQFADKLTPEIEAAMWCLNEAIALGYISEGPSLKARY